MPRVRVDIIIGIRRLILILPFDFALSSMSTLYLFGAALLSSAVEVSTGFPARF